MHKHHTTLADAINGQSLPLSRLAQFSLMDGHGNIVEQDEPERTAWPVPKSMLRPWAQLLASMQDAPRSYGGQRAQADPIDLGRIRHDKRVNTLLARVFRDGDAELRVAA